MGISKDDVLDDIENDVKKNGNPKLIVSLLDRKC